MARILFVFASLLSLSAAGCNVVTPVAYVLYGPGNVEARYTLDQEAATVVFVDDPSGRITDRRTRGILARSATATLMKHADMADMLDSASIHGLAVRDSYTEPMSITEMGAAVEADVVVYVAINEFTLQGPAGTYLPSATFSVKVIDVNGEERVWPGQPQGARVRVGGDYEPGEIPNSSARLMQAQESLAAKAGVAVGQLFYTHEINQSVTR